MEKKPESSYTASPYSVTNPSLLFLPVTIFSSFISRVCVLSDIRFIALESNLKIIFLAGYITFLDS